MLLKVHLPPKTELYVLYIHFYLVLIVLRVSYCDGHNSIEPFLTEYSYTIWPSMSRLHNIWLKTRKFWFANFTNHYTYGSICSMYVRQKLAETALYGNKLKLKEPRPTTTRISPETHRWWRPVSSCGYRTTCQSN